MEAGSSSGQRKQRQEKSLSLTNPSVPISRSGFFHLRSLGDGSDLSRQLICLRSDRVYTIGRKRRQCQIVLPHRCISRRHCQIFLDGSDRKIRLVDGSFLFQPSECQEGLAKSRVSLNGVFVNGRRLHEGSVAELSVGDEVLFGCNKRRRRSSEFFDCRIRFGFVVERIVVSEEAVVCDAFLSKKKDFDRRRPPTGGNEEELVARAAFLLSRCRSILGAADPLSHIRTCLDLESGKGTASPQQRCKEQDLAVAVPVLDSEYAHEAIGSKVADQNNVGNKEGVVCSVVSVGNADTSNCNSHPKQDAGVGCFSDGKTFFLNRLDSMGSGAPDQQNGVTLVELLHPVGSLLRVFITTFTCDISWFLSYCQVPNQLPVTVACHNTEKCWSAKQDNRTFAPFSNYPNLLLVFPPFPDVIAFGKDRKKQGVACHHPKLFVLQREGSIRVIVTSANLVSKQWNHVTNTVWWQDFPSRKTPDYLALFSTIEQSKPDFAAQLAGFIACLITDVPSQAHWITELTKYDFGGAVAHLVASVPGVHVQKSCCSGIKNCQSAKHIVPPQSTPAKFLGCIQASVVGLSHRFHSTNDSSGARLKTLASFMGNCRENANGTLEVILKRNIDIPADANAVSVLVADFDEFSEGGFVQLGFLPRDIAKWVSPLSDIGFFCFSAFIYPKETLAAVSGGSTAKVPLLLYVSQGPKFSEISSSIQLEHIAALCSLLASIKRCFGLWRLQEVLSQYKWPEPLESDFFYGSSSIGTSVNPHFLATFSAAAGKRSFQLSDSEESDPGWGGWNSNHELKTPSIKILFPTIERVKNSNNGIQPFRRLLSLSEKTWQRLRSAGLFHDAIPHPGDRVGCPMHVKVARRRFQSTTGIPPFGWIYCGSHNFSPAAWGQMINPSSEANHLGPRLHICNYELGIVLIFPPLDISKSAERERCSLDDSVLPFVTPAPKYGDGDRPATAQAMREALAEAAVLPRDTSSAVVTEEMDEDIPDEEEGILMEMPECDAEEKEEEKVYAEMLWSQVDSPES